MLTIEDEISEMRRQWPGFRATAVGDFLVVFTGTLSPLGTPYQVRIIYGPKLFLGRLCMRNFRPRVQILQPKLVDRHPETEWPVPHLYANDNAPDLPLLCLYFPPNGEFQRGRTSIAESIVPWTAEWLACYEMWLATGNWTGGGRHPEPETNAEHAPGRAKTAKSSGAAYDHLERAVVELTGTHASIAVLAHAATSKPHLLESPEWHFMYQELVLHGYAGVEAHLTSGSREAA